MSWKSRWRSVKLSKKCSFSSKASLMNTVCTHPNQVQIVVSSTLLSWMDPTRQFSTEVWRLRCLTFCSIERLTAPRIRNHPYVAGRSNQEQRLALRRGAPIPKNFAEISPLNLLFQLHRHQLPWVANDALSFWHHQRRSVASDSSTRLQ